MRKDRNSFFESTNFNMSSVGNMQNPMYPSMNMASSNFYQAQNMPTMPNFPMQMPNTTTTSTSEIESRLAKIERSINRLDARISKLEGNTYYTKEYDADGNMYIV